MRGTAGPGFSFQEQVDVRGGFSPSCCSTTPIQQQLGKFIQFGSEQKDKKQTQKPKNIDHFNKQDFMHQPKQVHGIPNNSELTHLQYFSFEFYLQFSSFLIQRKPSFIYPIKIQPLLDIQHISAIEQIAEYVVRSSFYKEFCNSLLEGILKVSVFQE